MHRRSVRPGESRAWRRAVVRMWGRAASGRRPTFFEPRVARPLSAHRWRDPFWVADGNYFRFPGVRLRYSNLVFAKYLVMGLLFWLCRSFLRFMGAHWPRKRLLDLGFARKTKKSGKKAAEYGRRLSLDRFGTFRTSWLGFFGQARFDRLAQDHSPASFFPRGQLP